MLVSAAHVNEADFAGSGDPNPGGTGCPVPFPHVEPVPRGPAGADAGRRRLSADPAPPLRGGSHRHPHAPAPRMAQRRRVARQESLASPLGWVGRRVVFVDRGARVLVRPARPLECRVLSPAPSADQGRGNPHRQRRRGRAPRCQPGRAGRDPGSLALGASGGGPGGGRAGRAVAPRLSLPFFFHSIYAESLFFLLATLSLDASARGQRLAAGFWGGLAATTRPMGVLLTPALAWGLWRDWRAGLRLGPRDVAAVLLPLAGLGAYGAYLWAAFGDPLAFWTAHVVGWHVEFRWAVAKYWRETYWVMTRLVRLHTYTHLLEAMRSCCHRGVRALTVQVFRRLGAVPGIFASWLSRSAFSTPWRASGGSSWR